MLGVHLIMALCMRQAKLFIKWSLHLELVFQFVVTCGGVKPQVFLYHSRTVLVRSQVCTSQTHNVFLAPPKHFFTPSFFSLFFLSPLLHPWFPPSGHTSLIPIILSPRIFPTTFNLVRKTHWMRFGTLPPSTSKDITWPWVLSLYYSVQYESSRWHFTSLPSIPFAYNVYFVLHSCWKVGLSYLL